MPGGSGLPPRATSRTWPPITLSPATRPGSSASSASARARLVSGPIATSSRPGRSRAARTMRSGADSSESAASGPSGRLLPSCPNQTKRLRGRSSGASSPAQTSTRGLPPTPSRRAATRARRRVSPETVVIATSSSRSASARITPSARASSTSLPMSVSSRIGRRRLGPRSGSQRLHHEQQLAALDGLPLGDGDLAEHTVHRRRDLVLHLHRLEDHHALPLAHLGADGDVDLHDLARHLGLDTLRPGRDGLAGCGEQLRALVVRLEVQQLAADKHVEAVRALLVDDHLELAAVLDDRIDGAAAPRRVDVDGVPVQGDLVLVVADLDQTDRAGLSALLGDLVVHRRLPRIWERRPKLFHGSCAPAAGAL